MAASNISQRRGYSDYETVDDPLPQQQSQTLRSNNYSSIEDIISALPTDPPKGSNLNVFIITQDSTSSLKPAGANNTSEESATQSIPVYSVVNKNRARNDSEREEGPAVPENTSTPHETEANNAAPPPPIPPRTYEMSNIGATTLPDLGDGSPEEGISSTSEQAVSTEHEIYWDGVTPQGLDLSAKEAESSMAFAIFSTSGARRNSYESVDLVFPDSGTAGGAGKVT